MTVFVDFPHGLYQGVLGDHVHSMHLFHLKRSWGIGLENGNKGASSLPKRGKVTNLCSSSEDGRLASLGESHEASHFYKEFFYSKMFGVWWRVHRPIRFKAFESFKPPLAARASSAQAPPPPEISVWASWAFRLREVIYRKRSLTFNKHSNMPCTLTW